MSKMIKIPEDRNPFVVILNGVRYSYPAGETIEVPDHVADVIEKYEKAKPKPVEPPHQLGTKTEIWIFELEDGSTVSKEVVLK